MNRLGFSIALGFLSFGLSGCGGSGKPAESPERPSGTSEAGSAPLPALEPAPPPPGVVAKLRIKNPKALIDGALSAAALPVDWRSLLEDSVQGRKIFEVFDVEGSLDFAMGMNDHRPERPYVMGSVGVRSVDAVLHLLEKENRRVESGPSGVYFFTFDAQSCAVGRAISGSPARVVCGRTNRDLSHFLAYALRGLPAEELSPADVHFEFDMRPVRARYGEELKRLRLLSSVGARQLHVGNPKFDRALTDAATGLADELGALVNDTETFRLQVFQDEGSFRSVMSLRFAAESSFVAHTFSELGSRQAEAPALFDTLPATASAASYSRESQPEVFARMMNILADLASGRAEAEGLSPALSERIRRLVLVFGPTGGQNVFGVGPLTAIKVDKETTLAPAWTAFGTSRTKADMVRALDDLSFLLSSREFKKVLDTDKDLPTLVKVGGGLPGVKGAEVYRWTIPALPSDLTQNLSQSLSGATSGAAGRALDREKLGFVAVTEVAGQTWMAWGLKKEQLTETFGALTSKDSQRLSDLGSLSGVRSEPAVSAGYFLLDSLVGFASDMLPPEFVERYSGLLRATPGAGKTPAVYFLKVNRSQGIEATWELRVPKEFIQDAAALVTMAAVEVGSTPAK